MDFEYVFNFLIDKFQKEKIDFAIIGGFALQAHGITRTTQDIDFLILVHDREKVKELMENGGFKLLYESNDVLNYIGKDLKLGRVDFLLAQRKYTIGMLSRAVEKEILTGKFNVKFIKIEDQIGLKVQSSSNDPSRYYQDMADIEMLIKNNISRLDLSIIREYFKIFDKEYELDKIVGKINAKWKWKKWNDPGF